MQHENTRIHGKALELITFCTDVIESLPPGHSNLASQLKRASLAVALLFAEGCCHVAPKERLRFFRMSKASAGETSMCLDAAYASRLITQERAAIGKDLCDHIGAMLHKFH